MDRLLSLTVRIPGADAGGVDAERFCETIRVLEASLGEASDPDPQGELKAGAQAGVGRESVDGGDGSGATQGKPEDGAEAGVAVGSVGRDDDSTATRGVPSAGGKLHLLIGDSIARNAPWVRDVLNRARGGNTGRRQLDQLQRDMAYWRERLAVEGKHKGSAIMWLGSNEAYPRGRQGDLTSSINTLKKVMELLKEEELIVIGPLPRGHERGLRWEATRAYWLERAMKHSVPSTARLYKPGHRLTHTMKRQRVVGDGTRRENGKLEPWFHANNVHVTPTAYRKIQDLLPTEFLRRGE